MLTENHTQTTHGKDAGKTWLVRNMSAVRADQWARSFLHHLLGSGLVPAGIDIGALLEIGPVPAAQAGYRGIRFLRGDVQDELARGLLAGVHRTAPDGSVLYSLVLPDGRFREEMIEDPRTLDELLKIAFDQNFGFCSPVATSNTPQGTAGTAEQGGDASPAIRIGLPG